MSRGEDTNNNNHHSGNRNHTQSTRIKIKENPKSARPKNNIKGKDDEVDSDFYLLQ